MWTLGLGWNTTFRGGNNSDVSSTCYLLSRLPYNPKGNDLGAFFEMVANGTMSMGDIPSEETRCFTDYKTAIRELNRLSDSNVGLFEIALPSSVKLTNDIRAMGLEPSMIKSVQINSGFLAGSELQQFDNPSFIAKNAKLTCS